MKIKTILQPFIVIIALSFILGIQGSKAQSVQPNAVENTSTKLSGSDLKSGDAITKCDAIFVGEITQMGFQSLKATGRSSYYGNIIKILQVLRGAISVQIKVTLYVYYVSDTPENIPKVGNPYIFFVKKNASGQPDPYTALKLLPATDDNITKVKALITAAPPSK
ncbi:hypothetical protein OAG63_01835 [Methylacidiphilales bacterium]|nr:hypothetical protein [Candidatus Methylacidiphilales bacterium]